MLAGDRQRQRGLTLVELLIAMLVFSAIAAASIYVLRMGIDGRDQLEVADARGRDFTIARTIIRSDLSQIAPRVVSDEFGARPGAPFEGGDAFLNRPGIDGETQLVAFVRRGWANPLNAPRPRLQFVEYVYRDNRVIRRARPYLDAARDHDVIERVLFDGVSLAEMSFLRGETSAGLDWVSGWPAPGASEPPRAVRLRIISERHGDLSQLFYLGDVVFGAGGGG